MKSNKKILIGIDLPIQFRNFIGSGLITYLANFFHTITIFSNPTNQGKNTELPENVNIIYSKRFRFRVIRIALYKAVQYDQILHIDDNYIHKTKWEEGYKNEWLIKIIQKVLSGKIKQIIIMLSNVDFLLNRKWWKIIDDYDLYISSTYIWQNYDVLVGLYCQKKHIPWLSQITSWDNPTTKGKFVFKPDKIIVWGRQNTNESVKYLDFSFDKIKEIPPPHLELLRIVKDTPIDNKNEKYIYYLGTSKRHYYWEKELIEFLLLCTDEFEELKDLIILLRPHPNDNDNWWEKLLVHPNLKLDNEVHTRNVPTGVYTTDCENLKAFYKKIKQSSGIITYLSTTSIEAGLLGIPVFLPYFVPNQKRPEKMPLDGYPHLKYLRTKMPNDYIIDSEKKMINALIGSANGTTNQNNLDQMYEVCSYTANIENNIFQQYACLLKSEVT